MGNGAIAYGSSHRAHPRLYALNPGYGRCRRDGRARSYGLGNPISMPMLTATDCCPFLGFTLQVGSMNQPTSLVGQNMKSSANSALTEVPRSAPLRVCETDGPAPTMNSNV